VITEWNIDSTGTLVGAPRPLAFYNGSGKASAIAIAAGLDGLYFSDFYVADAQVPTTRSSRVLRIKYEPPASPIDCNSNGIVDALDITAGTSRDCNSNGIPDECECFADFDGNEFVNGDDFNAFVIRFEAGC